MSRTPKTKSSDLAIIIDMANTIIKKAESCQVYHDQLIKDSNRLKEISPAINKMISALNPAIPSTVDNTGIGTETTISLLETLPVTKGKRHAKKNIDTAEQSPPA